jgi:RNA polymerase sigma factor (sigma-70 family)
LPWADRELGTLARARRAVLSDDRLAKQAAAGEIGALEAIFSRYRDDLYRFCVGILREPQDAQDAVQNTMIKAMRALPGERRQMQLKPWLYRIAHNEAVELRRRERPVEELPATVDDDGALTDERAEENGRLRTLLADIADLPERQRASLVLREVNGLGFGEIGAALGTSPGAVRQALYEARRCLAEMDDGRDMRCDMATRMVSDADGRPRDRAVRAHLRDCPPCRRFQAEVMERGRAFAAISPMPAIVVAGALKAALGGSGAAAGGAAAAAGGVGAAAGASGLAAGSIGASVVLKPAAGLLAVLAIGTAAVDHGAILGVGRHHPTTTIPGREKSMPADRVDRSSPPENHEIVRHTDKPSAVARPGDPITSVAARAPVPGPAAVAASFPATEEPDALVTGPRPRGGVGGRSDDEVGVAPASARRSPALVGTTPRDQTLAPAKDAPLDAHETGGRSGVAAGGDIPPGQAKKETVPPGQAKKEVETTAEPPTTEESRVSQTMATETSTHVPPGQTKQEPLPPGQAKKQTETTPGPTAADASAPAAAPTEVPAHVPPGQAKKEVEVVSAPQPSTNPTTPDPATEAPKVPPGQAKKEGAATE